MNKNPIYTSIGLCLMLFIFSLLLVRTALPEEWTWRISELVEVESTYTKIGLGVSNTTNVYMLYGLPSADTLKYAKSADSGITWTSGVINSTMPASSPIDAQVCVINSTTVYSIVDDAGGSVNSTFFRTTDSGANWYSRLTTTNSSRASSMVCPDANTVYHFFFAGVGLQFKKSVNAGTNFSAVATIDDLSSNLPYSAIEYPIAAYAISADEVYITYITFNGANDAGALKYAKTTDGGTNWTTGTISSYAANYVFYNPAIKVVKNTSGQVGIYIAYSDAQAGSARLAKSVNGGSSWALSNLPTLTYEANMEQPSIDVSIGGVGWGDEGVYITGRDRVDSLMGYMYYLKSNDAGSTWISQKIESSNHFKEHSMAFVSDSYIYVAYYDYYSNWIKTARLQSFRSDSHNIQGVQALATTVAPTRYVKIKDASAGDNLEEGLIPSALYMYDGTRHQRVRGDTANGSLNVAVTNGSTPLTNFYGIVNSMGATNETHTFGFVSRKILVQTPSTNTDDVCVNWLGASAVCPVINASGDSRIPPGSNITLDNFSTPAISAVSNGGTQKIYIDAWK